MLHRTLGWPLSLPFGSTPRDALPEGDLQASPDPRQVMRWAVLALSLVTVAVVLVTVEAYLAPGVRYTDVVALCGALVGFSLVSLIAPWQRLDGQWLLALLGGPIVFTAAVNSLTGAGQSPYFAIYAPILALAGWYLTGRQTLLAILLIFGTEAWRAMALDLSGSMDHLAIALPFGLAIAATASLSSTWLRGALAETRREQVRMAAALGAIRALGTDTNVSVLDQLQLAAARLFEARVTILRLGAAAPSNLDLAPALVEGRTATLLVKGSRRIHGLIRLEGRDPLSAQDLRLAGILAEAAGRTLDTEELLEETRADTERDPLTGLRNRRALDRDLTAALEHGPDAPGVALLFVDVDGFKLLNDLHGHAVGDAVLVCVANILRASARRSDGVYRFGGDEFAVLLRDASREQAADVTRRVTELVAQAHRRDQDTPLPAFSVSIGSALPAAGDPPAELLRAADTDMYGVKRRRRAVPLEGTERPDPDGEEVRGP